MALTHTGTIYGLAVSGDRVAYIAFSPKDDVDTETFGILVHKPATGRASGPLAADRGSGAHPRD